MIIIFNYKDPYHNIINMLSELRHDFGNHLQVIHTYARIGNNHKIIEYIDKIMLCYHSQYRISHMGHNMLATEMFGLMFKYPEIMIDYYTTSKRLSLEILTGLHEKQLCEIFTDVIIALAAQKHQSNILNIIISAVPSDKGKKSRIQFTLHGDMLEECSKVIDCLRKKLMKYNVNLHQEHQDKEVFDWEIVFNTV